MNKSAWILLSLACVVIPGGGFRAAENTTSPAVPTASQPAISPPDQWLARATPVLDDAEGSLNPYVLKVIDSYPVDGSFPYRWEKNEYDIYNGVSQTLEYQGRTIAKAHPNGTRCSNCCGITFEVFFRSMRLRNQQKGLKADDFNGMTGDDLFNAMLTWFVVGKGDSPQKAIDAYGLGDPITDWEKAKPGDFCDISRNNNSGHSVIFISWLRDSGGRITGMRYFSSGTSQGIGFASEYFTDAGGKVLREHVHLARVGSIEKYTPIDRANVPKH